MSRTSTYAYETGHRLARNLTLTPAGESAVACWLLDEPRQALRVDAPVNPNPWDGGDTERRYTRGWRAFIEGDPISADTDKCWRMGWRDADAAATTRAIK